MRRLYGGEGLDLPQHRIVLGVPQSGKTTFAAHLIRHARRVVVFDPTGDYESIFPAWRVVAPGELADRRVLQGEGKYRILRAIVAAGRDEDYDLADEFVYTVKRCKEARDLVLVADEVSLYKSGQALAALRSLHMNGHKWGIVSILVSQRAVGVPLDCRATATHVHSFLQDSEDDLSALSEHYDPSHPGYADAVRAWRPGEPPITWQRRRLYK